MRRLFTTTLITVLTFFSFQTYSQLTVGMQIRPRAEFRNGFKTLDNDAKDPAFFIEQRSRLFTEYKQDNLQIKFTLQDVRIWGSTNQIYKTDPTLTNIYEGWAKYQFTEKWAFKIGRQALDYDNARFLGNLDWAQQGRSHDALLFIYDNPESKFQVHIGGAFNQSGVEPTKLDGTTYLGLTNYKTMQYIWLHKDFENGKFSALLHNDGQQKGVDTMAYRQTLAVLGSKNISNVEVGGELYYQMGKNAKDVEVSAYLIAAYAKIKTSVTPITIGADILSGTSSKDTKDKSFNPLYGTNHKFYGYMDYFYVGNNHGQAGKTAGLVDFYLKADFKLGETSSLATDFHTFSSAAKLYETSGEEASSYLGSEVDLVLKKSLKQGVVLNVGYSQLFASDNMQLVKATNGKVSSLNNWAWAMINFSPSLLVK